MQAETNHSQFQQDFVSLNMDTAVASDNPVLFLRTNDNDADMQETCVSNSVMTEVPYDDACLAEALAVSISTDSQITADERMKILAGCTTQEPIRLLRPGSNQKPRRFYRTFWRGLSKRVILNEQERSAA